MIEFQARPMATRLSPIRCGQCGKVVGHMNKSVPGAEGGGMCLRCEKAMTYYGVITAPCPRPCCANSEHSD